MAGTNFGTQLSPKACKYSPIGCFEERNTILPSPQHYTERDEPFVISVIPHLKFLKASLALLCSSPLPWWAARQARFNNCRLFCPTHPCWESLLSLRKLTRLKRCSRCVLHCDVGRSECLRWFCVLEQRKTNGMNWVALYFCVSFSFCFAPIMPLPPVCPFSQPTGRSCCGIRKIDSARVKAPGSSVCVCAPAYLWAHFCNNVAVGNDACNTFALWARFYLAYGMDRWLSSLDHLAEIIFNQFWCLGDIFSRDIGLRCDRFNVKFWLFNVVCL